jgi:hypothetical protein
MNSCDVDVDIFADEYKPDNLLSQSDPPLYKYFLAFMLPDFKSKILTQLFEAKKEDGLTLFNLMGQCFHDVGLTEWTNIIAKQCPDVTHCMKENFDKCIRDYLKAVTGFPNVNDQLIHWLCTTKKHVFMLMHELMRC